MIVGPGLRKVALTTHIACSVGWLGAVGVFLALAAVGLTSQDAQMVRAAHLAMEPVTWLVIVPAAIASLATGLVQSLGTSWGLFRHYWVTAKLVTTVLLTVLLLQYTQTLSHLARVAADPATTSTDLSAWGASSALHAGLALVGLLVPVTLSVFKPRGLTPYGARKAAASSNSAA
jgi:hypothetical protein